MSDIMDECTKLKHIQKKMQAESQKTEKINSRSLRSSYGDPAAETNSSKSKNKRKLKDNMLQLNEVIPESLRRADLLEIVRDLHEQAQILDKVQMMEISCNNFLSLKIFLEWNTAKYWCPGR